MLRIQFSNRIERLCDAVVAALGAVPESPFSAQQIVVPSTAMRRYLTLAIAERHGICANIDCVYLAEWLWRQIARVVRTVAVESPFAASALGWRIYQLLQESTWTEFPRLENYLKDSDEAMRFELASDIAALFEQYITYRQDWMNAWAVGNSIPMPKASVAQIDDQAWQAELWRRISAGLGAAPEHPARHFLRSLEAAETGANSVDLPRAVHVFCLPDMPPLYLAVLSGLARWVDVTLYVLNPCREYWFDIVDPKRLGTLSLRGAATHHETGNRLLASWGKQTKAHIEQLLEHSNDAPLDDAGFAEDFPATLLGGLQQAIFSLTELRPGSLELDCSDRSIEVHVCHSLTRELEVLQDQLLALFAGSSSLEPEEVLIVTPDLDAAAPLIEAVFGNVPAERRLPYALTGRGRSAINAAARALMALLAMVPSRERPDPVAAATPHRSALRHRRGRPPSDRGLAQHQRHPLGPRCRASPRVGGAGHGVLYHCGRSRSTVLGLRAAAASVRAFVRSHPGGKCRRVARGESRLVRRVHRAADGATSAVA
jgi:exodeoxyribonuclease V gamma subunit